MFLIKFLFYFKTILRGCYGVADCRALGVRLHLNTASTFYFVGSKNSCPVTSFFLSNSNKTNECFTTFVQNTETFRNVNIFLYIIINSTVIFANEQFKH